MWSANIKTQCTDEEIFLISGPIMSTEGTSESGPPSTASGTPAILNLKTHLGPGSSHVEVARRALEANVEMAGGSPKCYPVSAGGTLGDMLDGDIVAGLNLPRIGGAEVPGAGNGGDRSESGVSQCSNDGSKDGSQGSKNGCQKKPAESQLKQFILSEAAARAC